MMSDIKAKEIRKTPTFLLVLNNFLIPKRALFCRESLEKFPTPLDSGFSLNNNNKGNINSVEMIKAGINT